MTRPRGRFVSGLRRGALRRQVEAQDEWGVQSDLNASTVARPRAVQLAIELAQSIGSVPRLESPAPSVVSETHVHVAITPSDSAY
jgi:hypothetical protein